MAGVGAVASGLPLGAAVLLAMASITLGLRHASDELSRPVRDLVIPCSSVRATIDGIEADDLQVRWRGPLAFLSWRDAHGRLHRLHGWPDNLGALARRELRLAMLAREPAPSRRSMAP
jgi:toxin CptA